MGCGSSKPSIIQQTEGDGNDFFDKYVMDRILGEGEFGVVRLIFDRKDYETKTSPLACKLLRKGSQFKNNTLYSAIKPKILRLECKILQTLRGQHHNLSLRGVYESPSTIYIVTDFNSGGDMFHYVSENYKDSGLRVEDISRMSFQLFDAVNHCAKHGIIHRDIKPENIMFKSSEKGSPLCLIDFGSGTMSSDEEVQIESLPKPCKQSNGDILSLFTTFAGSAFYISPEMFQRCYTCKTDVWSAGVTLYVLAAGYPFKDLQLAFNILHTSKNPSDRIQQLKSLPNMPNMPFSFYEMLEKALTFRHTQRMDAASLLNCEFVGYHKEGGSVTLQNNKRLDKVDSTVIEGLAFRHKDMHNYAGYEIAVSTLIASVLARNQLKLLLEKIDVVIQSCPEDHIEIDSGDPIRTKSLTEMEEFVNKKRLQIIRLKELQSILKDLKFNNVLKLLKEQERDNDYSEYAYHVAKLKQFYTFEEDDVKVSCVDNKNKIDNSMTRKLESAMNARSHIDEEKALTDEAVANSVHGNNVWESIKKQMKKSQYDKAIINRTKSVPDLTNSSHI